MKQHTDKDKGFTLVELLIVIVILGILAVVTVLAVGGITDTAKENTCGVEKATIETAIEAYFTVEGSYPASFADFVGSGNQLKTDPSARWTYATSPAPYTLTGIGDCAITATT